jgi:hypothetical protein
VYVGGRHFGTSTGAAGEFQDFIQIQCRGFDLERPARAGGSA